MPYAKELDAMTFSFSRISSFTNCKYEFYLKYIEGDPDREQLQNFYAAFGKFLHDILEGVLKGILTKPEAIKSYEMQFDAKTAVEVSSSTREKYYRLGLSYLEYMDFGWLVNYEILGVEKKVRFKIGKYFFVGFIDLLLRNKKTGNIVVIDHKSGEYPMTKNGTVKKNKQDAFLGYKRQLYLYCKAVFEEYGEYPESIEWNHFKDQMWLKIDFSLEEYEEAISWAENTIKEIYMEDDFHPNENYFYCNKLCGFRGNCEYLAMN